MTLTRRDLFEGTALAAGGTLANALGFDLTPAYAQSRELKISGATMIEKQLALLEGEPSLVRALRRADGRVRVRPAGDVVHRRRTGDPL